MVNLEIDAKFVNCKKIKFYELTGDYIVTDNESGWNTPNEDLANALTAELTILTPANVSYTFDLFGDFPTTDLSLNTFYELDSSVLGYGTNQNLPDGLYRFTYVVTTDENTYTQVINKLNYCNAKCCVYNMVNDIDFDCDCSKEKQERLMKAYLMLMGLINAADCGSINLFKDLLESLNKICNNNCSNC